MPSPQGWHHRGYLPHFDDRQAIQAVTYRLADSLPDHVLANLREQHADDDDRRHEIERFLDAGHGSCALLEASNARAVIDAWFHDDGTRYRLHAWVVMPNHVHVLVQPLADHPLGEIVATWKSITTRRMLEAGSATAPGRDSPADRAGINPAPKRRLWQPDYWDRYIRNERHYCATLEYIHQNPVKAGLVATAQSWPWSSARDKARMTRAGSS